LTPTADSMKCDQLWRADSVARQHPARSRGPGWPVSVLPLQPQSQQADCGSRSGRLVSATSR